MINASTEFWDFERASFDDELDAWRERTAAPASPVFGGAPVLAGYAGDEATSPNDHPQTIGRDRGASIWSYGHRRQARSSRSARAKGRRSRDRVQRSAGDRMAGSRRG
jgi:hypothetical protein